MEQQISVKGDSLTVNKRYNATTKHMLICDALGDNALVAVGKYKLLSGVRYRVFLCDTDFKQAVAAQTKGKIKIVEYAAVKNGQMMSG